MRRAVMLVVPAPRAHPSARRAEAASQRLPAEAPDSGLHRRWL